MKEIPMNRPVKYLKILVMVALSLATTAHGQGLPVPPPANKFTCTPTEGRDWPVQNKYLAPGRKSFRKLVSLEVVLKTPLSMDPRLKDPTGLPGSDATMQIRSKDLT